MIKTLIVTVVILGVGGAAYFLGSFSASFQDGICYSDAIDGIAQQAASSINVGGSEETKRFNDFIKSLPLYGYETNCPELQAAIKARKQ